MGSYINRRSSIFMLSIVLVDQLTRPNEETVKKKFLPLEVVVHCLQLLCNLAHIWSALSVLNVPITREGIQNKAHKGLSIFMAPYSDTSSCFHHIWPCPNLGHALLEL